MASADSHAAYLRRMAEKAADAGQWTTAERFHDELARHLKHQAEKAADNVTRLPPRKGAKP